MYTLSKLSHFGYEILVFNTQQGGIQNSHRISRFIRHGNGFIENWMSKFCNNRSVPIHPYTSLILKEPDNLSCNCIILIIVSLNNGRHHFLLIQFEYQSILRLFRSFFLDRQHISILFFTQFWRAHQGKSRIVKSWDVCSFNAVLIKYVRDRLFSKAYENWSLWIQCSIFL